MKAMTVVPGVAGSGAVTEFDGPVGDGEVLVEGLALGICGTDIEIVGGEFGTPPDGADRLVLGHESVGRVIDAPPGCGLAAGDLVVGVVRRPDPVPCEACTAGAWDMCRNGRYTERGITALHGYGAQQWRVEPDFAVRVPDRLGELAVLVEPASVVTKAWQRIDGMVATMPFAPRSVLVTGAGPIGLLAALLGAQRGFEVYVLDRVTGGPKPGLVADLGATYHSGSVADLPPADIVLECTGAPTVLLDVMRRNARCGVTCLVGVSSGGRTSELDLAAATRRMVLQNDVVFGSVNANRAHYEAAAAALDAADRDWLERLVTRRVPLDSWPDAVERTPDDVKVVVDLGPS